MLLFKKKFLAAIRSGEKTQTIRLWKRRQLRAAQASYVPGVGYIHIEAVDRVELDTLTDADAVPDGFPSADALRSEIAALYPPPWRDGAGLYRVKFRVMSDAEVAAYKLLREQNPRRVSKRKKPLEPAQLSEPGASAPG